MLQKSDFQEKKMTLRACPELVEGTASVSSFDYAQDGVCGKVN